jgi:hypothetical protein
VGSGERREGNMRHRRQVCHWMGLLLSTTLVLTSCTYESAVRRLSAPEQAEFALYRHVMTALQERTYLAQATATERTAYLNKIGLTQRLQALDPRDREVVRSGLPRQGMSAEALRFVWGEPYYTVGSARHYAHWFYLGSSFMLAASGNQYARSGTLVDVYLVDDHVVGWVDFTPASEGDSGGCPGCAP